MGNACGTDLYKTVKTKYKDDFTKFIVAQESKNLFNNKVQTVKAQVNKKVDDSKKSLYQQIDGKEKQVQSSFISTKTALNDELPGGIKSLEQMKQKSIAQILGFNQYKAKFSDIRNTIQREYADRTSKVHKDLNNLVQTNNQNAKKTEPNLILFNELEQKQKKDIYQRGVKQFKGPIESKLSQVIKENDKVLNPDTHLQRFSNVISMENVDHLVSLAKNKFKTEALITSGGSFDSSVKW